MAESWEHERRENFARSQQRDRLEAAAQARRERQEAQEIRDRERKSEQHERTLERQQARRESQQHARAMYDQRRADKLADMANSRQMSVSDQQEVTRREMLLREFGVRAYRQQLDDDYEHDVRTRNLDAQEYEHRSKVDLRQALALGAMNHQSEISIIREHLKSTLKEKLFDHLASEHAKRTASIYESQRIADESRREVANTQAESDATVREIWEKNEANKDFELFMRDLKRETGHLSTEEIVDILDGLDDQY